MTKVEAAKRIGIGLRSIINHENGMVPWQKKLQKYIDYYGCDEVWLTDGVGDPFPEKEGMKVREGAADYRSAQPDQAQLADPLIQAMSLVKGILDSKDQTIIRALILNLITFQGSIRKDTDLETRLKYLEENYDEIIKNLGDINKKINELVKAWDTIKAGGRPAREDTAT